MKTFLAVPCCLALLWAGEALAAVGCTLSNPAKDLVKYFPEMTSYKDEVRELHKMSEGEKRYKEVHERLGSAPDPVYETYDTPYTVYSVYKGKDLIGVVHGVNVAGRGGVIQVFLGTDPATGEIGIMRFQQVVSPAAKDLKAETFTAQFKGMTLADFYKHDFYAVADPASEKDRVAKIQAPPLDEKTKPDYAATLRGLRKNLILLDYFVYDRKSEPYFARAQEALAKARAGQAPAPEEKK